MVNYYIWNNWYYSYLLLFMNNDYIELYQITLKNIPVNSWMINEYFKFQIVLVINGVYNLASSPEIII